MAFADLFAGLKTIKEHSPEQQRQFLSFFVEQRDQKILPLFTDFTFLIAFVSWVFALLGISQTDPELKTLTPMLIYGGVLPVLFAIHRFTSLRRHTVVSIYLLVLAIITQIYVRFILSGGELAYISAAYIIVPFIGVVTLQVRHVLIIICLHAVVHFLSLLWVLDGKPLLLIYMVNWLTVAQSVVAVLMTWFLSHLLLRNTYALQFIVNEKNIILEETLRELHTKENLLSAQQRHKALSHMAAGILHEILNPINGSLLATGYAKSINKQKEVDEALTDAIELQQHIVEIISGLRKFAKGSDLTEISAVQVRSVVDQALGFSSHMLKGVTVENNVADEVRVLADEGMLLQVFINLFLNSARALSGKYAEDEGGGVVSIFATSAGEARTTITIRDNGPGISAEKLEQLFTPFYTGSLSSANTGLGLSICETIVRRFGGDIKATSVPEEWTEFSITLPSRPSSVRIYLEK